VPLDDNIASPGVAHRAMALELELIADLMGGTAAMRRAGQRWLPRESAESWTAWRARLNRTVLFNGLARTIHSLAGRPFASPVRLDGGAPDMQAAATDIDREGATIAGFASQMLQALLSDGLAHILVDRPATGGQPYFVAVRANQLIGARRDADGLAEIRIREMRTRPNGRFGESLVPTIRRIDRTGWDLWQPAATLNAALATSLDGGGLDGRWKMVGEGRHDFAMVPLVTMNTAPTGFMQARPPLIDLAWLNLAHWQSSSDQRHILHVARVPILFGRALQVADGQIEIGPNRLILADDPAADLRFVEHSGAAIAAGRQDLVDLEDRMAVLGLEMLHRRPGNDTATARAIDAAETHATLTAIIQVLRDGIGAALRLMAEMIGLPTTAAGTLVMTQQSPVRDAAAAEADLLLRARLAGEISQSAFLGEIARRGILGAASASPTDPRDPKPLTTPKPRPKGESDDRPNI